MNVVLYTEDLEAITVIDLPHEAMQFFRDGKHWRVAVVDPMSAKSLASYAPCEDKMKIVTIWAEEIRRKGKTGWILFTEDEEFALMLKSSALPGQIKDYREEFKRGFVYGFAEAILRGPLM